MAIGPAASSPGLTRHARRNTRTATLDADAQAPEPAGTSRETWRMTEASQEKFINKRRHYA